MTDETKKFKHSLVFGKSDIEDVVDSIWTPTIKDWLDVIEDYVEISKKRRINKLAIAKLQTNLIFDIISINDHIKGYKELIENPEIQKESFPELEITEKIIKLWEQELKAYKIILSAIKDVGDGIAWRLLDYNRSLIYNMCSNNVDGGPLMVNIGIINELNVLEKYIENEEVKNFVYHGITNFLLIGDLTVKYFNGEINFVEIKTQKNQRGTSWKERVQRQKDRAENLITIANEGVGASSGLEVRIYPINGAPNVCLKKIRTLLILAKNSELVSLSISQFLNIAVVNLSKSNSMENYEDKINSIYANLRKSENDKIITFNSHSNFIFTPNRTPLSIHPFTSEDITNILLGRYVIWYFFNIS
jgi:hypothetical protein